MANPYFNTAYYLANNPDVLAAGVNAEAHYHAYGADEAYVNGATSRTPAPWFDIQYYLQSNPDLMLAFAGNLAGAFDHFTAYGIAEGRAPSDSYHLNAESLGAYAAANADLMAAFGIEDPDNLTDAQQTLLASHYYQYGWSEGRPGDPAAGPAPDPEVGRDFFLTTGQDILTGTSQNDSFWAYNAQNSFVGGVSNTLATGDILDGSGGKDYLFAEIIPEFYGAIGINEVEITPRTVSIENIEFEARDLGPNYFGGITAWDPDSDSYYPGFTVAVDAKHMYGVERIGSKQSDGDLLIENLTTLKNDGVTKRNTSDLTITMDHTDNFDHDDDASDLTVFFDDNYLISGQTSQGAAQYWLLDQDADMVGDPLLLNINVDGIRFTIGDSSEIISLTDRDAMSANTHVEFVAALQEKLAELIAEGKVPAGTTLTLDPAISRTTFLDNGAVSSPVPAMVVTSGDGSKVTPVGFHFVEDEPGDFNLWARTDSEYGVDDQPVSVNIELTKVGRGGDGGNLIVGAKSGINGIEVFDVTVMGEDHLPNSLGILATTGYYEFYKNNLDTVNITSEARLGMSSYASLEIREGFGQYSLNRVDASTFLGDLTLGGHGPDRDYVDNLKTLVATGGGDVEFHGQVEVRDHYSYTTGSGDDYVHVYIDGDAVDRVDTSMNINTGSGNDVVHVDLHHEWPLWNPLDNGVSQATMYLLDNLHINTGEGNDVVKLHGMGNFDIRTGSGDDFVVINANSADGMGFDARAGHWHIGEPTGVQPFGDGVPLNTDGTALNGRTEWGRVLYNAELTVMFAGFESKVQVKTDASNNYIATQMDINDAIIRAIDANPDLARMLEVDMNPGEQEIIVRALVDGVNDFAISLYQPEVVASAPVKGQVIASDSTMQSLAKGIIATTDLTSADFSTSNVWDYTKALGVFNTDGGPGGNPNLGAGSLDAEGAVATGGTAGIGARDRGTYDFIEPDNSSSRNNNADNDGHVNYSVIDVGTGANDLIVLDSSNYSANTIVVNQAFGKTSVVNFFFNDVDGDGGFNPWAGSFDYVNDSVGTEEAVVGLHHLDFTHYLNNQVSSSGSVNSITDAAVVLSGDSIGIADATANSVSMLLFDHLVSGTVSFDAMTAANLLAVLNGDVGAPVVGGIVDGDLDAVREATLVGRVQDHIVMVENMQNKGEFKIFHLTSEITGTATSVSPGGVVTGGTFTGDFASAEYLGILDFGYGFADVNDQTYTSSTFMEVNLVGSVDYYDFVNDVILGL